MDLDIEKIDEAVLALLYLSRLHEKGFISNPARKAKSVRLTEEGLRESERLFTKLFVKK